MNSIYAKAGNQNFERRISRANDIKWMARQSHILVNASLNSIESMLIKMCLTSRIFTTFQHIIFTTWRKKGQYLLGMVWASVGFTKEVHLIKVIYDLF